jgi:hypothetical protein
MSRDWLLLPMIGVLTVIVMAVSAEWIARRQFSISSTDLESCLVLTDIAAGVHGIPNAVCQEKMLESPLVEYRLDAAGYRSGSVAEHKSPGTYRIVMIGSSLAMGERVPFEQSVAALLPQELSRQRGRKIELYNEGMAYGFARNADVRFQDALAAEPDLILWLITPLDIEKAGFTFVKNAFSKPASSASRLDAYKNAVLDAIRKHGGDIVIGQALRHWLYELQSQSQYIRTYLLNRPDEGEAGFLRTQPSAEWRAHLAEFDHYAADMAARASAAGVPLAVAFAPNRVQAAMISAGEWPPGFDPYAFAAQLRDLTLSHGALYVDILADFRALPGPEHGYYPLDGHPNAQGQAVLARLIAQRLGGAIPEVPATASAN